MSTILLLVAAGSLAIVSLISLAGYLYYKPRKWNHPASDVIILAAHQDDCVVLAAEYSLWALDAGRSVSIVYLTAGSPDTLSVTANTRKREALSAWRYAGVAEKDVYFLGYKQTELSEDSAITAEEMTEATDRISEVLRNATPGTSVFLPAAGESHVDHQTVRHIGILAAQKVARDDLTLLEAPEYNPYLSVPRSPLKTLRYFCKSLPLVSRLSRSFDDAIFPGFISGEHAYTIPVTASIRDKKIRMLRMFESENSDLLEKHFSWTNQFRPVKKCSLSLAAAARKMYVRVGDHYLGPSVSGLWLSILAAELFLIIETTHFVEAQLPYSTGIALGIFSAITLSCIAIKGRKRVETRLIYLVAAFGLLGGTFF